MEKNGDIPKEVRAAIGLLEQHGFSAYLVGGCVRDVLLGRDPKDWDVATKATPAEIQKVFPESVYENEFGTVGVKTDSEDPTLKIIEVTTFRLEGRYTDKRHPDEVRFAKTIEEDLSRRDFTVNALAMPLEGDLIDPYGGQKDLEAKIIRTVGDPKARFSEDALRLMRAVRFSVELDFEIEAKTRRAIETEAGLLEMIAKERIRDEFTKIMMSARAAQGITMLEELDLLRYVMPELRDGLGVGQNKHHIYTVFEHNLRALDYAVQQNYSLEVRMAALLHDVAKPRVKGGDGPDSTFYNHEYVGAKMTLKILDNLRYSKEFAENVAHLVRHHMFYYNTDEVSAAGVRRFLARVGPETVDDLLKLREADRIGSGVPKAVPYKTRHLQFMIDKVKADPISPKMLKVKGEDVMKIAGIEPGPKVGQVLAILLEEVLDAPEKNESAALEKRVKELTKLPEADLVAMREKAEARKEEFEQGQEEEMKKKHWVK
ncbi:MAG TPA: HD domain-containing protein [Candidatus Paceibacterota bacterium]|nr:HD domain-containing protein [Candidatus Paceibacterota bacterium]